MKKTTKYIIAGLTLAGAGVATVSGIIACHRKKKRKKTRKANRPTYTGRHLCGENCLSEEDFDNDICTCNIYKNKKEKPYEEFQTCVEDIKDGIEDIFESNIAENPLNKTIDEDTKTENICECEESKEEVKTETETDNKEEKDTLTLLQEAIDKYEKSIASVEEDKEKDKEEGFLNLL